MILLDTHVWIWWVLDDRQLKASQKKKLKNAESEGLGVSIFSCWEVGKLVELGRLKLPLGLREWLDRALGYPGVELMDLTVDIVVEATQLPGDFHRDPADQILVATARRLEIPLATADSRILEYPHVDALNFKR